MLEDFFTWMKGKYQVTIVSEGGQVRIGHLTAGKHTANMSWASGPTLEDAIKNKMGLDKYV